jgi:PAS domain S-box-containing protein/diguanylate cyclase (GGDEF)-like protein
MSAFHDAETYRTILEALQTGVCAVDLDNRIQFWNDGAERLTGYLRHEVIGRSCVDNIQQHCNHVKCELCIENCPLVTAVHLARPVEASGFVHHKGGHRIPVHIWAVPMRDARGFIIGAVQSFDRRHGTTIPASGNRGPASQEPDESIGIASQATMTAHLLEALGTFADTRSSFGLFCVRVNELDQVRARYGHEAAALLLSVVGETLENLLRPGDFAGRWKDDQFLAILPGCTESGVISVCNRILKMVATASIHWWGSEVSASPISLGHATPRAGDKSESISERLKQSLAAWNPEKHASAAAAGTAGDGSAKS